MSMSYENSSPGDNLVFDVGSPVEGGGGAAGQPEAVTAQAAEPDGYVPSYRGELDDQPAAVTSFEDIFGAADNGYSSSLPALDTTTTEQNQPAVPVKATQDTAAEAAGENIAEDVTGTATGGMDEAFADLTPEQIDSMSEDELLAHYTGEPISLDDGIPSSLDEYDTTRPGVEGQASGDEEGGKKAAPILTLDVHKILGTAGNAVDQVTKKALTLPGLSKLKPSVTVGSVFVRAATVAIILILLLFVFSAVSKLESGTGQTPVAAVVELPDSGEVKVTNIIRRDNKTYATVENTGDRTEHNISVSATGGAAHIMNPVSWFSPSKDEATCGGGLQSLEAGQSQDIELGCDHQVKGFRVGFDAKVDADE